jgi:hypothetical protein
VSSATHDASNPAWCDRAMVDPPLAPGGLAAVLRRVATDQCFADAVTADPASALARYDLSAADLSALAMWLDRPAPGVGIDALFDSRSDRGQGGSPD